MRLCHMNEKKLIAFTKRLNMPNGTLYSFIAQKMFRIHNDTVKASRCPIIDTNTISHHIDTEVAQLFHTLRDCHVGWIDLLSEHLVKDLIVVQVHSCLNRRKRRIRILCRREMIVEDNPLGKKAHEIRRILIAEFLLSAPAQCVHEDIQNQFLSLGTMSQWNGACRSKRVGRANAHGPLHTVE